VTPYALQKNESLYFLHFHGYNTHTNYYAVTLHPMYKCISFQTCNQQSWLPHTVYKYLDSPTRRTDGVVPGLSLIVLQCYILLQLIAQYFHTSNVTGLLANVARNTAQTNPVLRVRRQRTSTGVLCVAMCCNVAQCCSVMVAIAAVYCEGISVLLRVIVCCKKHSSNKLCTPPLPSTYFNKCIVFYKVLQGALQFVTM